jgi:spore coat protein U-like protein
MKSKLLLILSLSGCLASNSVLAALACTYAVSSPISFGAAVLADPPAIAQTDVNGTITANCTGGGANATVRICLAMPVGGGTGSTLADRRMASGTNFIQFNFYKDPAYTQIWGTSGSAQSPHTLDVVLNASGVGSGSATIYGRIASGQTGKVAVTAGTTYSSAFSGGNRIQGRVTTIASNCATYSGTATNANAVTASVILKPNCTIIANNLNFGSVTSLTANVDATSSIQTACSKNAVYNIKLNGGTTTGNVANRRMQLAGSQLSYQLYLTAARTTPWQDTSTTDVDLTGSGITQNSTIYGRVPIQSIPLKKGTYTDTITATVTF